MNKLFRDRGGFCSGFGWAIEQKPQAQPRYGEDFAIDGQPMRPEPDASSKALFTDKLKTRAGEKKALLSDLGGRWFRIAGLARRGKHFINF